MSSDYQPLPSLKFPWQAPLTPVEEGCFGARRYNEVIEPEEMSVIERKLFEANPRDFEWCRKQFEGLPEYLVKYFATRYITACTKPLTQSDKKAGFNNQQQKANTFLREKMRPAAARVRSVMTKYKNLPTTQKVALLSEEYSNTDQSDLAAMHPQGKPQLQFDFDNIEKNRKPVKNRILAELEQDELRDMAFKLSQITAARYQVFASKAIEKTKAEQFETGVILSEEKIEAIAVVGTYHQLAEFVSLFGIKAPRKRKKQTEITALNDISKMISDKWWQGRLVKVRKIMREHLAIAMGQVSYKASPYCSWDCVREHDAQQKANYEYIKQCQLLDEETGDEADLWDMVKKSVANPAIRRHELMVRCRGCEDIGNELGLQGLFLTLTTPSKYHNSYKKGGFIGHWNGASPRDAQSYLNNVWQRIRAKLGRDDIRWFGVRVAEPHHDGTPHWHLLIWVKPEDVAHVREVFITYATHEDREELLPHFDRNEKRAEKKQNIQGPMNYKPRCDFGYIDPEKGTATGYIAKYISKNIDGYAMDDALSDETGKPVKDMAKNVSAWKSRWAIRQFQFFGGAPVTTYRELRRFANQNKKAFMEYVFMQERADLICLYDMLNYQLVGPVKPAKTLTNAELVEVIAANFEARANGEQASVSGTLKAADHGNWKGYIMGQGGPFVKRDDLLIVNAYEVLPFASPHGEDVRKIEGFTTSEGTVKTRTKVWTIKKKAKVTDESEAITQGSEATVIGGSAASRSSVNNCTEPREVQVSDQLTRLLAPERKQASDSPNIDDATLAALLKGYSIRIDDERSLHIRPAEADEHGNKRAPQMVEVTRAPADDLSWMDFEGWDQEFAQPEQQKDEYQQPDLSFFPERDDDWPLA
ncbi:replication endonuclease [Vibrio alginolyticus]|uniref:replication endonuclease n=1 Tax=Vibrio alginolyticus TaxID=663 RepID=UPI00375446F7